MKKFALIALTSIVAITSLSIAGCKTTGVVTKELNTGDVKDAIWVIELQHYYAGVFSEGRAYQVFFTR